MPVSVEVPPRYVRRARQLAAKRNESFEESESYDNDSDTWGVDPEERNFRGLMGEFAFAEYADLTIDASTRERSDGGCDFRVRLRDDAVTIDVKTSSKQPKALMVKEYAVNADYYVLGHLEEPTVTFYGGASKESVLNGVRKESPYGHVNYTLGVDYLDPLPSPEDITQVERRS